jgi:hypothetical protein
LRADLGAAAERTRRHHRPSPPGSHSIAGAPATTATSMLRGICWRRGFASWPVVMTGTCAWMREMHAQKKTFWRRCSQRKREAGDGIEPVINRRGSVSSVVKVEIVADQRDFLSMVRPAAGYARVVNAPFSNGIIVRPVVARARPVRPTSWPAISSAGGRYGCAFRSGRRRSGNSPRRLQPKAAGWPYEAGPCPSTILAIWL